MHFAPVILSKADGLVEGINRQARNYLPFALLPNEPDRVTALTAGATKGPIAFGVNGDGPVEICYFAQAPFVDEDPAPFKVMLKIQEGRSIHPLCNGQIHSGTIFGTGRTPYPLPDSLYVDELRKLIVEVTSLVTDDPINVRMQAIASKSVNKQADPNLTMARKRQDYKQFLSMPYWYTLDDGVVTVPAQQLIEATITIGPEHHFLMQQIMAVAGEADPNLNEFFLDIIDLSKGESIIAAPGNNHQPVSSKLMTGDANYPYCLVCPKFFQISQRLLVRLYSNVQQEVYLTLGGMAMSERLWR